ncbi:MAG: hypothetical protein FWG40_00520 [Peptococcaceae bacterium]|nr:hypothetical protein [Peptococcaceae bacterium]
MDDDLNIIYSDYIEYDQDGELITALDERGRTVYGIRLDVWIDDEGMSFEVIGGRRHLMGEHHTTKTLEEIKEWFAE